MSSKEGKKKEVERAVFGKSDEEREGKNAPVNFFLFDFSEIFICYMEFFGRYASPSLAFCLKKPEQKPVHEYLSAQGRFRRLDEEQIDYIQKEVDKRRKDLLERDGKKLFLVGL